MAMPPIARASWMGVTVSAPWPMATEMFSPGYHFWRNMRIFQVVDDALPVRGLDAHGKLVGVKNGPAHHGQDFSGAWIESHHGALAAFHRQFGHGLQIQVDRELQILARDGLFDADDFAFPAA